MAEARRLYRRPRVRLARHRNESRLAPVPPSIGRGSWSVIARRKRLQQSAETWMIEQRFRTLDDLHETRHKESESWLVRTQVSERRSLRRWPERTLLAWRPFSIQRSISED